MSSIIPTKAEEALKNGEYYVALDTTESESPSVSFLSGHSELFEFLDKAHRANAKIMVMPVGKPIINWR